MRDRLPSARPLRFDEGRVAGLLIVAGGLLASRLLWLLGRALRAGDDALAEFTVPDLDDQPRKVA